jgi:hypothetical protein
VDIEAEPAKTLQSAAIANWDVVAIHPPVCFLDAHFAKVLELILGIKYAVRHPRDVI